MRRKVQFWSFVPVIILVGMACRKLKRHRQTNSVIGSMEDYIGEKCRFKRLRIVLQLSSLTLYIIGNNVLFNVSRAVFHASCKNKKF